MTIPMTKREVVDLEVTAADRALMAMYRMHDFDRKDFQVRAAEARWAAARQVWNEVCKEAGL